MFFALFLALFGFDAERRGGAQQQTLQPDGVARFGAPAVFAAGEGVERVVNLVEQLLFPLQQP